MQYNASKTCFKNKEIILKIKKEIKKLNIDIEARKEEKCLLIEDMNKYYNSYIQQQKEIEKLKEIILSIRHELKGNIISKKDDGSYGPAKNLTKQEVYKSYLKLICLLKANRVFLEDEDAIKELLEE